MADNLTQKSFWKKPEGITGLLFIIGLVVGFYFLLPIILSLIVNTIYLIIFGVILAALIYCIIDPSIRTGFWYLFKMAMRAITGLIVRIDPIAIMEVYISNLKDKREQMSEQISKSTHQSVCLVSCVGIKRQFKIRHGTHRVIDHTISKSKPSMKSFACLQSDVL